MGKFMTTKKKVVNPLYVVRNNGVDVESASGIVDLILKKTGLDQMFVILENLLNFLMTQVNSYPMFIEVKKIYDQLFEKFVELMFQAQALVNSLQSKKEN